MEQRLRDGVVKEVAELESGESRAVDRRTAWGDRAQTPAPARSRGCAGMCGDWCGRWTVAETSR
jgi:hypothetical protein